MEVPRFWRLRGPFLKLEGSNCPHCEKKHFPPQLVCHDCGYHAGIIFNSEDNLSKDEVIIPKTPEPVEQVPG